MKVNILGVATTEFGELWNKSPRALARQAIQGALKDANLKATDIDALYVGNMLAGILGKPWSIFCRRIGVVSPSNSSRGCMCFGRTCVK